MTETLTHLNAQGKINMVDVTDKTPTCRTAVAIGEVRVNDVAWQLIRANSAKKGDVVTTAKIAGIMAAKKTSELIPLCHQLSLNKVSIDIELPQNGFVSITATARCNGSTGVEMEALTAVSVAALTVYDMIKAVDKTAMITNICLEAKSGGKSGDFYRSNHAR